MSVQFEDPRGKFLRRVSRLEAQAQNPLNAPIPTHMRGHQKSWLDNKVAALFLGMFVLVAVRIIMFHNPVLVAQAQNFGLLPGMAGAYVIPLAAALLCAGFAGHFQQDYWVPSLGGIGLALFFEPFIMLFFPDIWGLAYSPEYVAYVGHEAGSLSSWHETNTVPLVIVAETPTVLEDASPLVPAQPSAPELAAPQALVSTAGFTAPTAPVAPEIPDIFGLSGPGEAQ